MRYRSKPTEIEAVRYGKDDDGRFYVGAVNRVAAFILGHGPDAQLTDVQVLEAVQPSGAWDPPKHAELLMLAGKDGAQGWVPLPLGHWVVRQPGDLSDHWPVDPDYFAGKYETAEVLA